MSCETCGKMFVEDGHDCSELRNRKDRMNISSSGVVKRLLLENGTTVEDAITEKIHNSMDAKQDPFKLNNFYINIEKGPPTYQDGKNCLIIADNCKGMNKQDLSTFLSCFDPKENLNDVKGKHGKFGIGGKFALLYFACVNAIEVCVKSIFILSKKENYELVTYKFNVKDFIKKGEDDSKIYFLNDEDLPSSTRDIHNHFAEKYFENTGTMFIIPIENDNHDKFIRSTTFDIERRLSLEENFLKYNRIVSNLINEKIEYFDPLYLDDEEVKKDSRHTVINVYESKTKKNKHIFVIKRGGKNLYVKKSGSGCTGVGVKSKWPTITTEKLENDYKLINTIDHHVITFTKDKMHTILENELIRHNKGCNEEDKDKEKEKNKIKKQIKEGYRCTWVYRNGSNISSTNVGIPPQKTSGDFAVRRPTENIRSKLEYSTIDVHDDPIDEYIGVRPTKNEIKFSKDKIFKRTIEKLCFEYTHDVTEKVKEEIKREKNKQCKQEPVKEEIEEYKEKTDEELFEDSSEEELFEDSLEEELFEDSLEEPVEKIEEHKEEPVEEIEEHKEEPVEKIEEHKEEPVEDYKDTSEDSLEEEEVYEVPKREKVIRRANKIKEDLMKEGGNEYFKEVLKLLNSMV